MTPTHRGMAQPIAKAQVASLVPDVLVSGEDHDADVAQRICDIPGAECSSPRRSRHETRRRRVGSIGNDEVPTRQEVASSSTFNWTALSSSYLYGCWPPPTPAMSRRTRSRMCSVRTASTSTCRPRRAPSSNASATTCSKRWSPTPEPFSSTSPGRSVETASVVALQSSDSNVPHRHAEVHQLLR
jgi:hypothetical protein